jgi:hypothetical protein
MLCPFAVVERIRRGSPNYAMLSLGRATVEEDVKALSGCRVVLFLDEFDTFFVGNNFPLLEVVLCKTGEDVHIDTMLYGTALLRRTMPVVLEPMSTSLLH